MPGTAYGVAKNLNIPIKNPNEFFAPSLNLKLGTKYFSYSLSRFQNNALYAVASYNGGAGAVKSWIAVQHHKGNDDFDSFVENIPFRETRDYVRKVFGSYWNYLRVYGTARI
jgi:soluble lytic murein transglycosylase